MRIDDPSELNTLNPDKLALVFFLAVMGWMVVVAVASDRMRTYAIGVFLLIALALFMGWRQ